MKSASIARAARTALFFLMISLSGCKEEAGSLEILITGDVLLDRGVLPVLEEQGVENVLREVTPLFRKADAVIINLECPLTDTVSTVNKGNIFRADTRWAQGMANSGITHATMANNHTMDQGHRGIASTRRSLIEAGIIPIGYGLNKEEQISPIEISKGNISTAIFSVCMMTVENWICRDGRPGVCIPSTERITNAVEQYHKLHPSTQIIVIPHWGVEYKKNPSMNQIDLAHKLIKAGASAVVGHHPHITQPTVQIDNAPVFYSLGSFVFDQPRPECCEGSIARLVIHSDGRLDYDSIPIFIDNCRPVISFPRHDEFYPTDHTERHASIPLLGQ